MIITGDTYIGRTAARSSSEWHSAWGGASSERRRYQSYLACVLGNAEHTNLQSYALIDIPSKTLPRFVILPDSKKEVHVILLEDIIRFNLSNLFAPFGYNQFSSHIVKLTRDAEIEIDNDFQSNVVEEIEKGLKSSF